MNRREAKRVACQEAAGHMMDVVGNLSGQHPGDDAERVAEATYELAEELYRRAGLDKQARAIDERQLTIYDELELG